MKLTFVTASLSRNAGGLFESVRRLAQSVGALNNQVDVIGVYDNNTSTDIANWDPLRVNVHKIIGPERFNFSPGLLQAVSNSSSEIIHSHAIWNFTSIAVSSWHRKTNRPYIIHPHGMLDEWAVHHSSLRKKFARALYENRHLQNAACIRALCESEAKSIRAFGLTNPIAIIPNGIDLPNPKVQNFEHTKNGIYSQKEKGKNVLLYLGRIHPKKGLVNLLQAWKSLTNSSKVAMNNWGLAIAGWDEKRHESELKQQANELGLSWSDIRENYIEGGINDSPSVLFLGPQFSDMKAISYYLCDAFILPSFSEGLPMTVLEAWSYAKPVLITPECNLPEGFEASAAINISPNIASIEMGLYSLINKTETERSEMGARGKQLVLERFGWPRIAHELYRVSEWVTYGGKTPESIYEG